VYGTASSEWGVAHSLDSILDELKWVPPDLAVRDTLEIPVRLESSADTSPHLRCEACQL